MKRILSNNIRMCVVTRKRYTKTQLLKITRRKQLEWVIDKYNEYQGRSFYLEKKRTVILKFLNKNKKNIKNFELNKQLEEELLEYANNL